MLCPLAWKHRRNRRPEFQTQPACLPTARLHCACVKAHGKPASSQIHASFELSSVLEHRVSQLGNCQLGSGLVCDHRLNREP